MRRLSRLKQKTGVRGMRRCGTCGQLYTYRAMNCPVCFGGGQVPRGQAPNAQWLPEAAKAMTGVELMRAYNEVRAEPNYTRTPRYAFLCAVAAQQSGIFSSLTPQMLKVAQQYWEGLR